MIILNQNKCYCPFQEHGGLLCVKAALASVLLVACGLRRRNIQVDLGALRGLHSSYCEKPGQLVQGDPRTYSTGCISEWSWNEGCYCCCLERETPWGLIKCICGCQRARQRRSIPSNSYFVAQVKKCLCQTLSLIAACNTIMVCDCYLNVSLVLNTACPCSPVPCRMNRWLWSPWRGAL